MYNFQTCEIDFRTIRLAGEDFDRYPTKAETLVFNCTHKLENFIQIVEIGRHLKAFL